MNKLAATVLVLVLVLAVSVAANIYFVTQNYSLNSQLSAARSRVDMTATLSVAQTSINSELETIGQSLVYASKQLSVSGLTGDHAQVILNALVANSSYIINAATENLSNIIVAVAPNNWSYITGRNVGDQTYLNTNPYNEITPMMTPLVGVQSDMMANIVSAPVFDSHKQLIGTVSVIFNPAELLRVTVSHALDATSYTSTVMQIDGLMIYDTDPLQLNKNMFTDPAYANYTQLLLLGHHVAEYSSGYGTYKFTVDAASQIVVNKECYWTTVYAFGQQWRVAIQHSLS